MPARSTALRMFLMDDATAVGVFTRPRARAGDGQPALWGAPLLWSRPASASAYATRRAMHVKGVRESFQVGWRLLNHQAFATT